MLQQLIIQDIAIVDFLKIEFESGLNVITGETGAGKSLLVDALGLLRGQRVENSLIREGADQAAVSGVFRLPANSPVYALLENLGIPKNTDRPLEIILRRILQRNGKHRAFVNDFPVASRTLVAVSSELIDISSQFEHQRLLEPQHHTRYLDIFVECEDLFARFKQSWDDYLAGLRDIRTLEEDLALRARERALLEFELAQIEAVQPTENEFSKIQEVVSLGGRAQTARSVCRDLLESLTEGEFSCRQSLRVARKAVERLHKLAAGAKLPVRPESVDEILIHLDELANDVLQTDAKFDVDEEELSQASEKLESYDKLLKKFGPRFEDLRTHETKCRTFLEGNEAVASDIEANVEKTLAHLSSAFAAAKELTVKRRSGIAKLTQAIERELKELGMMKAQFSCQLVINSNHSSRFVLPQAMESKLSPALSAQLSAVSASGFEAANFLLSANPGVEPKPLELVASGGELSRIMLAMKSVLFEQETTSIFVFDEIDTGISGSVAAKVGKKISEFCAERQALCITHLPQVACFANAHFVVSKVWDGRTTKARVKKASREDSVHELSKMLSGELVTPESVAQARVLLSQARPLAIVSG